MFVYGHDIAVSVRNHKEFRHSPAGSVGTRRSRKSLPNPGIFSQTVALPHPSADHVLPPDELLHRWPHECDSSVLAQCLVTVDCAHPLPTAAPTQSCGTLL